MTHLAPRIKPLNLCRRNFLLSPRATARGNFATLFQKMICGLVLTLSPVPFVDAAPKPVIIATMTTPSALDDLDGSELVHLAVERDEALRRSRVGLMHNEETITERLDPDGHLLSTQTKRQQGTLENQTLGASDQLKADRDEKATADATGRQGSGNFSAVVDLRKLASRFDLVREADGATADGRACYVVRFQPRAVEQSYETREEKVVNQLKGRFWLAKDDLSIAQSEGMLTRAVSVAWVAAVYKLNFRYHTQVLPGTNATVPARFVLDLGVKAPFYHARERQTTTMNAFKRSE